jgi:hypothetical protein
MFLSKAEVRPTSGSCHFRILLIINPASINRRSSQNPLSIVPAGAALIPGWANAGDLGTTAMPGYIS